MTQGMIVVIAPFPPPVHGAAAISEAAADLLAGAGLAVRRLSTSPGGLRRSPRYHLRKAMAVLAALATLLSAREIGIVYLAASGGWGRIHDLAFAAAARLRRLPLVVHHHSFSGLERRSRLLAATVALGPGQTHIALCPAMARRLARLYPAISRIETVSNAAFLPAPLAALPRLGPLQTLGFLSNITAEKGIAGFFTLVQALREAGFAGEALVAGPIADPRLTRWVAARAAAIGGVSILGPLDAPARTRFYGRIDLLVFPSRYRHEAEPLVVLEAQRAGVPVAASARGCLIGMLADKRLLMGPEGQFAPALLARLAALACDPAAMARLRERTARHVAGEADAAPEARARFLALFGAPAATSPSRR